MLKIMEIMRSQRMAESLAGHETVEKLRKL